MMWDVYLGGLSVCDWRKNFKSEIGEDISVFDPMVDNYAILDETARADQTAKELTHISDKCTLIVFYWNNGWDGSASLVELGDAVGRGKQVIVCLDGDIKAEDSIRKYCEFNGVPIVETLDELVMVSEEYFGELEICEDEELAL